MNSMKWSPLRAVDARSFASGRFVTVLDGSPPGPAGGQSLPFSLRTNVQADIRLHGRRILKRSFDVVSASILLILLAPLLAIIALLVKRDGGPCLFGHTRIGQNGIQFKCLKFRSMVTNADVVLKDLIERDPVAREEWQRDFKLKNDIRITKVGRFIRHTSIDELPQLWNVLRGEMSLVGPRPIVQAELERYGGDVAYYLVGRPGITGLWQVSGRSDIDYAARVSLDVSYVKDWCIKNDIKILLRTVLVVIKGRGAY
jgi:Undecaprenyl-phosphate galactose phosphotransferase WbaP